MRWTLALLLLAISWTAPAHALPPTHDFTLDNGLRVLVREDHRAPVVTVMVWVRVGSIDEPAGLTGISHMLEHMMFKNTRHLTPGDYAALVSRFGGQTNAFTSYDYTGYYQTYEVSRLPLALELEAERLRHFVIDDEEFAREVKVVMEERRQRTDDNPDAVAHERINALLRAGTGYAHPVIGWMDEIRQYTPEQALAWFRQWYVPENMVLVIAGDVTRDQAEAQVRRFFDPLPAATPPPRPRPFRLAAPGAREVTLRLPVQVPSVRISWNVPSISTLDDPADFHALTLLAGVLDGGYSARIERELVRGQRLAAGAGAGYNGLTRGDGTFGFSATPVAGVAPETLRDAFLELVTRLQQEPPTTEELQRVRAQVVAANAFGQDSVEGQAQELGLLAMLDLEWDFSSRYAEALAHVTPEQVSDVARRYLTDDQRLIAWILPQSEPETTP